MWVGTWEGGIAVFDGDKFRKFDAGERIESIKDL